MHADEVDAQVDTEVDAEVVATADAAAARAGCTVADVRDHGRMQDVSALFDAVWGRAPDAGHIMAPEALVALAHAGGQVTTATREDRLVGATAAFIGLDDDGLLLHSHVTGVVAEAMGDGVGAALKWYQRRWALERGIRRVRWTFDPAIRRNAVFGLTVLGAQVHAFLRDLYGAVPDDRNASLPTDRIEVTWDLTAPRVRAAAAGRVAEPDVAAMQRAGAVVAVDVGADDAPVRTRTDAPRVLVRVPVDIEALRTCDRGSAARWADVLREELGARLEAGWRVHGMHRDGWYVLSAREGLTDLRGTG